MRSKTGSPYFLLGLYGERIERAAETLTALANDISGGNPGVARRIREAVEAMQRPAPSLDTIESDLFTAGLPEDTPNGEAR